MSDIEKRSVDDSTGGHDHQETFERPTGLKGFYYHPVTQVSLLGFVLFMGPGMFNALNGLGAGGQLESSTNSNANTAVYSTFAAMAFFAGSVNNAIGSRITLFLGSMGYALYVGSYLATNIHHGAQSFVIAAGAILGICAGLIWAAQGSLMMSYPTEQQKGRFIAIFWTIFNLGGVLGGAIAYGLNAHSSTNSVGNPTYIAFLVLTLLGVILTLTIADPRKIIRTDGTKVVPVRQRTWKTEIKSLYVALHTDPLIVLLFPMFFASNWFYAWQFTDYNGAIFNIGARSLNSMVYWAAQIVGAVGIGFLLDMKRFTRRQRAYAAWIVIFLSVFATHIWAYHYQKQYTRESVPKEDGQRLGVGQHGYVGRILLYVCFGILDSMWQTSAYWMMGAMSNDPAKLAVFAGFYKSIQSAGGAGSWRADGVGLPYMNIFISTWVLLVAGLLFMLPMIHMRIRDTTVLEDEAIVRMDGQGHVRDVGEYEAKH